LRKSQQVASFVHVDNQRAESDVAATLSAAALCARTNCALSRTSVA